MAEKLKPPYDTPECDKTGEIIEKMYVNGWGANISYRTPGGWSGYVFEYERHGMKYGYAHGFDPLDTIRKAIWHYLNQDEWLKWWMPPPDEVLAAFERFGAAQPSDYIGRCDPQLSGTHV